MEFTLLILIGLALPVIWTIAFFMGLGTRTRVQVLEQRNQVLEQEVLRLAARPRTAPDAAPAEPFVRPAAPPVPQVSETPPTVPETPVPTPPQPEPARPTPPPPRVEPTRPTSVPQQTPAQTATATPDGPGFEETFGTRWVVIVGGLALALGAIFLVKYTIEEGLIGPGMRIILGALLSAGLIGGGEWLRRRERDEGLVERQQASIPAILTAAGTTAAFATTWSAYGLYSFIAPGSAFILLGIVAMATLAAALLHGPALAGLGLIGAYVTPMLVSTKEPSFWALYLYLLFVTAAAFALARFRLWRWLAVSAVTASALWILPGLATAVDASPTPHQIYVVCLVLLAAALIVSGFLFGPEPEGDEIEPVSSGTLIVYAAVSALLVVATSQVMSALAAFTLVCAIVIAVAWRAPSAIAAVPVAAILSAVIIAEWAVTLAYGSAVANSGLVEGLPITSQSNASQHLVFGALFALLFGGSGYLAQGRYERPMPGLLWAASAVVAPLLILAALYYRVANFERSIPFAGLALLLAALYATATEMLDRRPPRPGLRVSGAVFAVGSVASLALALTMALEKGWLTIALALMTPGIAFIYAKRPYAFLRWIAAACGALVCARIGWMPTIVSDLGTTPIFNWLLWGYGVPAVAFWTAATILRRGADDVPARMLDGAAILFTVLTVTLQIRHYMTGGNMWIDGASLSEAGLQVSALLAIAIGLERLRERTKSEVHNIGAIAVAGLAVLLIWVGLMFTRNPLNNIAPVGGRFFNVILLAYGIPSVLAIILALTARHVRKMPYRVFAAGTAVALALMYLTLQVRRLFVGEVLRIGPGSWPSDAELWTYSAVWLVFGVVLLLIGIALRSQPARMASAIVILITVCKVFLFDLAGIGGIWRALSFIGLGLVLVGIGLLYQRLLFPQRRSGAPSTT
ncbi:hypothetical protein GJW-30_1_01537 [Variibacter gotjawalensis]|uniref:DUF2339 domain-containing protein n=1 Tax=Variibacter gotjawalensis TaxID=1333996 RepID=A0A0S3PSS5_9BRAD|nr:DUF2339 domain-containing protein [Variibacter gotjawalensis]NIK49323.1 putative membrane protein [Variibacter gotjawalensis]RZS51174.1 putative membrane protein [Variibacter gotjawalensis]BAT59009.1 hypothetical protein GJW-30_1_01537 [Variibacter gotjawalensis]